MADPQYDFCRSFQRNDDGSWTAVESVLLEAPNGSATIAPGDTFAPGVLIAGVDLAEWLDEHCMDVSDTERTENGSDS